MGKKKIDNINITDPQVSYLGDDAKITGEIEFATTLLVNGSVKGSINSASGELIISPSGDLNAKVKTKQFVSAGKIKGDIESERVLANKGSKILGDISTKLLVMEKEVEFTGVCNMFDITADIDPMTMDIDRLRQKLLGGASTENSYKKISPKEPSSIWSWLKRGKNKILAAEKTIEENPANED